MKTQSSDAGGRGRHANYSTEYIREALELWRTSGRSATTVAAEPGIRRPLLNRWAARAAQPGPATTPPLTEPTVDFGGLQKVENHGY
jgi:hypothetical protein